MTKSDDIGPHPVKYQFPGVEFCVNSNPTWVILGTIVLIASIIVPTMGGGSAKKADLIQTILFVAGVNTLLQAWFGTRLPVVVDASFRFVISMLYISLSNRFSFYINPNDVG